MLTYGSLGNDVFEQRTSTGSEPFSLLICLDATKYVWLSIFTLTETNYQKIGEKLLLSNAKRPLSVDVCRSKTTLLKFPLVCLGASRNLQQWLQDLHTFPERI